MEHVGFEPNITHGAMHGPNYSGNTPFAGTNYLNERVDANYHVYAIEWNSTSVRWFVDGVQFYSVTRSQVQGYGNWVFDHPILPDPQRGRGWQLARQPRWQQRVPAAHVRRLHPRLSVSLKHPAGTDAGRVAISISERLQLR